MMCVFCVNQIRLSCKICVNQVKYEGETGQSAVTRLLEQIRHLISIKPDNPMVKHVDLQRPAET